MQDNNQQARALITGYVLTQLGFQLASESTIVNILRRIKPKGQPAFRDAFIGGCSLMLKLADLLQQFGFLEKWNFIHVVLTDGRDEKSQSTLGNVLKAVRDINQKLSTNVFKMAIIGVEVTPQTENELKTIAEMGEESVEYYNAADEGIEHIFQRITVGLGMQERQEVVGVINSQFVAVQRRMEPTLQLQIHNFAVLLNLEVSESMRGSKWNEVCSSVEKVHGFLGNNDIIAAMVFNEQAKLLKQIPQNDPLFQNSPPIKEPAKINVNFKQEQTKKEQQEKKAKQLAEKQAKAEQETKKKEQENKKKEQDNKKKKENQGALPPKNKEKGERLAVGKGKNGQIKMEGNQNKSEGGLCACNKDCQIY